MESLGERLKKGREAKNISLDDICQATKISKYILKALENDEHTFLPPKVLVRGFIRSYCRYVGLEETELLALYEEFCAPKPPEDAQEQPPPPPPTNHSRLLVLIVLLVLAILLAYPYYSNNISELKNRLKEKPETPQQLTPAIPAQPAPPEPTPRTGATPPPPPATPPTVITTPTTHPPAPPEAPVITEPSPPPSASVPFQMKIKCHATTWIGYVIDNKLPSQVLLFPDDEVSWEGKEKIALKIGNAGGIKITVDEVTLNPLGKSGEVMSVVFGKGTLSIRGGKHQSVGNFKAETATEEVEQEEEKEEELTEETEETEATVETAETIAEEAHEEINEELTEEIEPAIVEVQEDLNETVTEAPTEKVEGEITEAEPETETDVNEE